MNEKHLMMVILFNPEYTVPLLENYISVHPLRLISNVLILTAIFSHLPFFGAMPIDTIWNLVLYLDTLSLWCVFIAYSYTRLSDQTSKIYDIVTEIDAEINQLLYKQTDWKLTLLASTFPSGAVIVTISMFVRGLKPHDLPFLAIVPIALTIMDVNLLKYIIAKRLRYIRTAEEFMGRVEDTVFITRQLLECNTTLNITYGPLAACYTLFSCQLALQHLYFIWAVYGAGKTVPFEPMSNPFLVSGVMSAICYPAVFIALSSSLVVYEVKKVSLELDIMYSARDITDTQLSLIYMFLMELHHTSVDMSAVGLFRIGLGSFSNACAVFITYLLVLIQFT